MEKPRVERRNTCRKETYKYNFAEYNLLYTKRMNRCAHLHILKSNASSEEIFKEIFAEESQNKMQSLQQLKVALGCKRVKEPRAI